MAKNVKLIGGTNDGRSVRVNTWQPLIYMPRRMSVEENAALMIDDVVSWKPPEEVYERNDLGEFVYTRTVHYKPAIQAEEKKDG